MLATDSIQNITAARINHLAKAYHKHIPRSLQPLEQDRLSTIPAKLGAAAATTPEDKPPKQTQPQTEKQKQKQPQKQTPSLASADLTRLTEWKLKRGKFRPTLKKLVSSNADKTVAAVTRRAYAAYNTHSPEAAAADRLETVVVDALKTLAELRGVGPATASLLLSVFDAERVPFFSDELFAWVMSCASDDGGASDREEAQETEAEVPVWKGKMAYSLKEYGVLWRRVDELRMRLREEEDEMLVPALDVEHAAWMIVKGLATEDEEKEDDDAGSSDGSVEDKVEVKAAAATDSQPETEAKESPAKKRKTGANEAGKTASAKKTKKRR